MSVDLLGAGALAVVSLEWLALGWLSGVRFPSPTAPGQAPTWALRLLVGAALVASAQLLLALVGVGFGTIPIALLVAAVGAAALRTLSRGACSAKQPPSVDWRERLGWLLLGTLLLAALVRSLAVPESGWDAFSHWGLRAQAFAEARALVDAHSEHEYYPPLVPLLEAWLYLHRGLVSIDLGKTVWAVIGGAFAVVLGWHLRLSLGPARWAAPYLALAIVLATPALLDGFWTGQADLALTGCLTLATLAAWQWLQTAERPWLVQAAVFAAAAALTKFEGLPRILLLVGALALEAGISTPRQGRVWLPIAWLVGSAGLAWVVWTVFEVTHAIAPNAEHIGPFQPLAIGGVLAALLAVFGGVRTGGGVLVAIAGWACAAPTILRPPLRALVLVSVAQALGTLGAFLVSATAPELEVLTSATRLVEQFMPVALFVAAVGLARTGHL